MLTSAKKITSLGNTNQINEACVNYIIAKMMGEMKVLSSLSVSSPQMESIFQAEPLQVFEREMRIGGHNFLKDSVLELPFRKISGFDVETDQEEDFEDEDDEYDEYEEEEYDDDSEDEELDIYEPGSLEKKLVKLKCKKGPSGRTPKTPKGRAVPTQPVSIKLAKNLYLRYLQLRSYRDELFADPENHLPEVPLSDYLKSLGTNPKKADFLFEPFNSNLKLTAKVFCFNETERKILGLFILIATRDLIRDLFDALITPSKVKIF